MFSKGIINKYKQDHTFEKRKAESSRIRNKYPDRIPVVVQKDPRSSVETIDKNKYLVPSDLTVGQFMYVIRKRLKMKPEMQMFIFVNNKTVPPVAALMSHIYKEYKDEDGFLYFTYNIENTFGTWR